MGRAPAKRAPVNDPKKTGVEGAQVEMTAPRPKGTSIMPPGTRSTLRLILSCNHASTLYPEYLYTAEGSRETDRIAAAFIDTNGLTYVAATQIRQSVAVRSLYAAHNTIIQPFSDPLTVSDTVAPDRKFLNTKSKISIGPHR